ncbi:hypothetical protein BH18PSE1_BH18PSE1_07900 [soil metagenome]
MGSKSEHQHPIGADFWTFSNGRLDVYICSPRLERGHRGDAVLTRGKAQAFPLAFDGISCPLALSKWMRTLLSLYRLQ